MTCRDVDSLIVPYSQGASIPPEAAAHIAGCPHCQRLARAMAEPGPVASPSPEQFERIMSGITADLKPVKPLAPMRLLVSALLAIAAFAAAAGVFQLGTAGWRAMSLPQAVSIFGALAISSAFLAVALAREMAPGSRLLLPAHWSVLGFLAIIAAIFSTVFQAHAEPAFVATGLTCLRIGLECAIPAAALCWLVLRRGAVLNPVAAGALTGAVGGLSALTLLEIFCPNLNAYHVLAWHLGVLVVSTLVGTAVGIAVDHLPHRQPFE